METKDLSANDYPRYEIVNPHYTGLDLKDRNATKLAAGLSPYEKLRSFVEKRSKKGGEFGRQLTQNMTACDHKESVNSELENQAKPLHKRCQKLVLALLFIGLGSVVGAALAIGIYVAVTNLKSTDDGFVKETSTATFFFSNHSSQVCPAGFFHLNQSQSCYRLITDRLTWEDSKERCISLAPGAHLAAILNKEQDSAIIDYLKGLNYNASDVKYCKRAAAIFYTAGQRVDATNCNTTFVWKLTDDEQRELNFTNWRHGEDNCAGMNEACLSYDTFRDKLNFYWNDINCGDDHCSICEANPVVY